MCQDYFVDAVNSVLIPEFTPIAGAHALVPLLLNSTYRMHLGTNAQALVHDAFNPSLKLAHIAHVMKYDTTTSQHHN